MSRTGSVSRGGSRCSAIRAIARASRAGASLADGRLPCPARPRGRQLQPHRPLLPHVQQEEFPAGAEDVGHPDSALGHPVRVPQGEGEVLHEIFRPVAPADLLVRVRHEEQLPPEDALLKGARTAAHQCATPSPFVSRVPRPYRKPSRISAENGGTLHSSARAGTTSMWWMSTSPGSSVPPTWQSTFGFSGFAPNIVRRQPVFPQDAAQQLRRLAAVSRRVRGVDPDVSRSSFHRVRHWTFPSFRDTFS